MNTNGFRDTLYTIIFEANTPSGKAFDVALFATIGVSVTAIMLESVPSIAAHQGASQWFKAIELITTLLFTIEYVLRLISVKQPLKYAFSFFGIVDFLSIIPTYLALFAVPEQAHYLTTIRILRLLRLFRIFKMARYIGGANLILMALRASRPKIVVFLFAVVTMAIIMGTIMYIVEGPSNPAFSSIPESTYWAIVTITTVGYGDIAPLHPLGKFLASFAMITGYAIIAVPTGIVGAEINRQMKRKQDYSNRACNNCGVAPSTRTGPWQRRRMRFATACRAQ